MILFLGSGVSLASGLPSVENIKDELLKESTNSKTKILLETLINLDSEYLEKSAPFKTSSGIIGYTGQIYRSKTTYEDLFYLMNQIVINGEGLKADLTVEAFTNFLCDKCESFLDGNSFEHRKIDLYKICNDTKHFVEEKVAYLLKSNRIIGLDIILDLAKHSDVEELNIVTLNHDILVEQLLENNNIEYSDGFNIIDGDVKYFNNIFDDNKKVKIIKLHGSVNWWRVGSQQVMQSVVLNKNMNELKNNSGQEITDISKNPYFLTGIGKINSYNQGIFADQQFEYQKILHKNDTIVMSGYGWGDIPLNFQLLNWFEKKENNKIILLHQKPDILIENSLELRHVYSKYINSKKLIPIKKWLSDIEINELLLRL